MKPLYDNIIIKPIEAETKTAGGLYIVAPEVGKQYSMGEVIAVGSGYRAKDGTVSPLEVKVGDTIYYRKGVELSIDDNGEKFFVVSEGNVFMVK